jgi:hypothetical protein
VRSHDLNRLLDEPGLAHGGTILFLLKLSFALHRPAKALVSPKPRYNDGLRPSLQWRVAQLKHLARPNQPRWLVFGRVQPQHLLGTAALVLNPDLGCGQFLAVARHRRRD